MTVCRDSSFRKPLRQLSDVLEEEDDRRRDHLGRKRVDVIECLLESSPEETDDIASSDIQNRNAILWLTYTEICHICYVLAQTSLSTTTCNKKSFFGKLTRGQFCARCRKKINTTSLIDFFLPTPKNIPCTVCSHIICKKCSVSVDFTVPQPTLYFAVRVQTLLNSSSVLPMNQVENKIKKLDSSKTTMCHNCAQVFIELSKSQPRPFRAPMNPLRRTLSLPTKSTATQDTQHTRQRRPLIRVSSDKNEKIDKTKIRVSYL